MFQLDEKFLQDIGLDELPENEKKPFLQHIYDELEIRVGTKLSDGLSDNQLDEFESIIDHKEDVIENWLAKNDPDYKNDLVFIKIKSNKKSDINDLDLRSEYAASKWLEINRPNYRDVVAQVLDDLKNEVVNNKAAILGTT